MDCIGKPEYDGKTIGVISLTGEDQARYIEHLLLEQLGPDEVLGRRIKCGDAYAFQGDERDVMFLSMVATPTDKGNRLPALAADTYRRRFNVSASRARDQMWLFHSVTQADLNPDCLRWKLLEHFLHPDERGTDPDLGPVTERDPHPAFDSLFEQRVYLRIKNRGYRARPQVTAYGYRIDLVVIGGEGRLAVECDGDQWHGPEQYERDLARQQDLERVGWRFVRIRESEFYLDPEAALRPLWAKLNEVGIRPFGEAAEAAAQAAAGPVDSTDVEAVVSALLDPFAEAEEAAEEAVEVGQTAPSLAVTAQVPAAGSGIRDLLSDIEDAEPFARRPPARTQPSSRVAMAKYPSWKTRPVPDPREARQSELVDTLLEVVAAEGPMLAHRAYRLILQAAGFHRLVHTVVSPLNKAAVRAEREGRLVAVPSGVGTSLADRVLRLPSQAPVVVRERGPRELEELPASEIQAVARLLRDQAVSPIDRELKRDILAQYGRVALTIAASTYLEKCLRASAPLGPAPVMQQPIWPRPPAPAPRPSPIPRSQPAAPLKPGVAPGRPPAPEFRRVLADTIVRAQNLSDGARSRLAAEWLDEENEIHRLRAITAASVAGAPREWSTVARIVSSTLSDWPAAARAAVADAAFALTADGVPADAGPLLMPWQAALRPGRAESSQVGSSQRPDTGTRKWRQEPGYDWRDDR